jgi:hypothetical protein
MNVKKRLLVILISVVLFAFSAMPAFAAGSEPAGSTPGVEVTAKAEPVYVFAAPPGILLNQSQFSVTLGSFLVGDLFLESGEWLTLTVIPGQMLSTNSQGWTLPYHVDFNPPPILNAADIGDGYEAKIRFDPGVLENAYTGIYQALLLFRVTSHPDGIVVWEGYTTVTINISGREYSEPYVPIASSTASSSQVTTSSSPSVVSKVSAPSKVSKPSVPSAPSTVSGQPGQPPYMGAMAVKYGLPAVGLILLLLFVLICVTGRKRKPKNSG